MALVACRFGEDAAAALTWIPPESWGRLAAGLAVGVACRRRPIAGLCLVLAGLAAYQCGAGFAGRLDVSPAAVADGPWTPSVRAEEPVTAVVRIRARPRVSTSGRWNAPATVVTAIPRAGHLAGRRNEPLEVYLRGEGPPPATGGLLVADLDLRPPPRADVPGGFDTAAWLAGRGITAMAHVAKGRSPEPLSSGGVVAAAGAWRDRIQRRLREHLARGLPPREAAIAGGVLLGGGTAGALRDPFARLGLAHLFALSGLHVGILAGLCLLALAPFGAAPVMRLLLLGPLLVGYAMLVDLPGSVVRAVGLVLLALLAPVAGRRVDSLRLLGILLWANVLWQPAGLLDTGTRLSYLAAGGIVSGQRLLAPWLRSLPRLRRGLVGGLGVSVSAQIATLPEVARSFGYLPLAGPVANLLLVPVFGFAVMLLAGGLVTSLVWPWAGESVLACAWLLLRSVSAAAAGSADLGLGLETGLTTWGLPRALGYGGLVAVFGFGMRRRGLRGIALAATAYASLLAMAAWRVPAAGGVDAWQFAVGQGDAALLRFPDGWTCLVDTGAAWRSGGGPLQRDVLPFLRRRSIGELDAVVLTHGHADHTGGRDALAAAVPVHSWYTAGSALPGLGRHVRSVAGDTLHAASGWALVCLHPGSATADYRHENDHSLVLGLCRDGLLHALWTGDLEREGEHDLLGRLPAVPPAGADVLKAGHHGSATSSSPALLQRLRPRLVLISCGVANRHRHPSHGPWVAATESLATARTDLQGTVHLRWDRRGRFAARAMRPLPPAPSTSLDTP